MFKHCFIIPGIYIHTFSSVHDLQYETAEFFKNKIIALNVLGSCFVCTKDEHGDLDYLLKCANDKLRRNILEQPKFEDISNFILQCIYK